MSKDDEQMQALLEASVRGEPLPRTTDDLVKELEREAASIEGPLNMIAIAVGFENTTEFVFGTDDDKVEKLDALMDRGGQPIGLIAVVQEPGIAKFYSRPFKEYVHDPGATVYLNRLVKTMAELVKGPLAVQNRWIN